LTGIYFGIETKLKFPGCCHMC